MSKIHFKTKTGKPIDCTTVEIPGQRIFLRPTVEEDAQEIFANFNAAVTRYMTPQPPERIEETLTFISSSLEGMKRGDTLQFTITDKSTGEFLGLCGLSGDVNIETPELGIWTKTAVHGNGYGKEAIVTLVGWAERHLVYEYLIYPVDRANIPSRKIPEALGGKIFKEELSPTPDGRVLDIVIYHIFPSA